MSFARIRAIDIETTGDRDKGGRLCEIGCYDVLLHTSGQKTFPGGWSAFCNPGFPIPLMAKSIHHIGDDDVRFSPTDHRPLISRAMDGVDVYVFHGARYDLQFLPQVDQYICTHRVALRVFPDAERHNLQYLRYYARLDLDQKRAFPAHRAGPDAYVAAMLFAKMLESMPLARMLDVSKNPALLPRCSLGKYRDVPWSDIVRIDPGFLQWLSVQPFVAEDEDLRFTVSHWLRGAA